VSLFIAIEGIDGAGTSTQCARVAEQLRQRGKNVHITREPSDNPIGKLIRGALSQSARRRFDEHTMALLFAADRLDHLRHEVDPALAAGSHVLSDRYVMSSLAYQAEIMGEPDDGGWIRQLNAHARHPDLTIFVDVDASVAFARRQARGGDAERYDDERLQERLVLRYRTLASVLPRCVRIDGAAPPAEVTDQIVAQLLAQPASTL
jgi:dTMP kinase